MFHALRYQSMGCRMNDFKFPNVDEHMLATFLRESMKPEEINGEDTVRRDRMIELLDWFARYPGGGANGKWFVSHAYEILYYVATYARAPVPNLTVVANWLMVQRDAEDLPHHLKMNAANLLDELGHGYTKPVSRKELEDTLGTCRRICARRENPEEAAILMCLECMLAGSGVPVEKQ